MSNRVKPRDGVIVACCQVRLAVGEVATNRDACRAAVSEAARAGAQLVVLPELANSGYVFADPDEAQTLAEPLDGETVGDWIELARRHDLIVVGGLCEREANSGETRNSAVIVDGRGVRVVYRKAHLWDREPAAFVPGSEPPPVLGTRYGRISVMVCYDVEFPEWVRLPALAGTQLLCVPTNWPLEPRPAGERPAEVVRVQAAASGNRMFVAACDRAARERGVGWVGGSVIVGPDGFPMAGPAGENEAVTIIAHCRLAEASSKRIGERNDALADRRPALYGGLVEAH